MLNLKTRKMENCFSFNVSLRRQDFERFKDKGPNKKDIVCVCLCVRVCVCVCVCVHVCMCVFVCVCFVIQVLHQSRYKNGSGTSFWDLPLHLQISIQGTCSKKHWYCSVHFLFLQSQITNSISSGLIAYPVNFVSSIYYAPIMLISLRNLLVFF